MLVVALRKSLAWNIEFWERQRKKQQLETILSPTCVWLSLNIGRFTQGSILFKILKEQNNFVITSHIHDEDTSNFPKWCKEVNLTKPNSAFHPYYHRNLLLFSRPMRDKDTSALREKFQYSSLAEKPFNQWEIATHWRPHHCDPHLGQTKFNDLLPLTIDGVLTRLKME